MKTLITKLLITSLLFFSVSIFSQKLVEHYEPQKKDSLQISKGENDFLAFVQKGYTLMLPENSNIKGVLIFLEDSKYDAKNKSAKQLYSLASEKNYAVLSVSTEIPFDFYFTDSSITSTHQFIKNVFKKYNLPNENIFFLGASLVGHRAMRYIKFTKENNLEFQLNIKGIVISDFTLDWTRKWKQHKRDIRINKINLGEATFINYMLETYLKGTPKTSPENYHEFSPYSYFDDQNRNIKFYKDYAVRAYIDPAINYRLKKYYRTLYENNTTDIVGFLAELKLAGNDNTELISVEPCSNTSENRSSQASWDKVNKKELMDWIVKQ